VSEVQLLADGCDVAPHCLECPLSICKFEDMAPYKEWQMQQKASTDLVLELRRQGLTRVGIARKLEVDVGTIRSRLNKETA